MAVPAGMTVRAATLDDVAAVCALLNAVDEIELGRAETELHEVAEELGHPDVDLERDSWLLADADGRLVGYGLVRGRPGDQRIDLDQYLLPDQLEGALHLFDLMEGRAGELAAAGGAQRAVLHLHLNSEPTVDTDAMRRRGWSPVRRHHVLTRSVDPVADPAPVPPPGVTLRACADESDRRTAHRLLEESFADHFDFRPRSYEQWLADVEGAGLDWSLVWIAAVDGLGDAAVLRTRDDRSATAWASQLGVVPAARSRGLGGHLLRHFFAHYAARGRTRVGLGVDTANTTGAPALYARHGMVLDFAVDTWELVLPLGS
ncbi:GNAT family N-acetyltransferase [Kitasatospora sp. NPDC049285]|uniref:GNAT family N-acetyltransferase n=1 Tax=Kitasatospora sp. NPDC049285 TaxID=3157096 RepID=UPI0034336CBE